MDHDFSFGLLQLNAGLWAAWQAGGLQWTTLSAPCILSLKSFTVCFFFDSHHKPLEFYKILCLKTKWLKFQGFLVLFASPSSSWVGFRRLLHRHACPCVCVYLYLLLIQIELLFPPCLAHASLCSLGWPRTPVYRSHPYCVCVPGRIVINFKLLIQ